MKTCPKCKSVEILAATPIDRAYNDKRPMQLETYGDPDALVFKDTRMTTVSARVCEDCGYTELYADNPAALKQ